MCIHFVLRKHNPCMFIFVSGAFGTAGCSRTASACGALYDAGCQIRSSHLWLRTRLSPVAPGDPPGWGGRALRLCCGCRSAAGLGRAVPGCPGGSSGLGACPGLGCAEARSLRWGNQRRSLSRLCWLYCFYNLYNVFV